MAIRNCNIEPSDDPELDAKLMAQIEEGRRLYGTASMDCDDFLRSIGEDPDE